LITARRWQERGILTVSDVEGHERNEVVDILIGADYANKFLEERIISDGETAWKTAFGGVLSGPHKVENEREAVVQVKKILVDLNPLRELDQPFNRKKGALPAFPLCKCDEGTTQGYCGEKKCDRRITKSKPWQGAHCIPNFF